MSTIRVESKSVDNNAEELITLSVEKSSSTSRPVEIDTQKSSMIGVTKEKSNENENRILKEMDSIILGQSKDEVSYTKGNLL